MDKKFKKYSVNITNDSTQPAAQAMLHAIGLTRRVDQPFIGIASTGYEGNPCNMHLNDLSKMNSVKKETLTPLIFNTIGVSDSVSMGTKR